jgi:hypothetical protein
MNHTEPRCRVYDPEALSRMGRAFDKAVSGLAPQSKADANIRQNVARCIIRLFDDGERAPLYLSAIALSIVVADGRKPASRQRIAPFYPIGVLFPSDTDGQPLAA